MTNTRPARERWRPTVVSVKLAWVLVLVSVLFAGCTSERTAPPAHDLAWVAHEVPQHPGLEGRSVLRDATWCDDAWWLVGGRAPGTATGGRYSALWSTPRIDVRPRPGRLDLLGGLRWAPEDVPTGSAAEDMHRAVLLTEGRLQAVGPVGSRFASWTRTDDGWQPAIEFGRVADSWRGTPYASVALTANEVLATVSTGDTYEPWGTPQDESAWRRLSAPMHPSTASDHTLVAATNGDHKLPATSSPSSPLGYCSA